MEGKQSIDDILNGKDPERRRRIAKVHSIPGGEVRVG